MIVVLDGIRSSHNVGSIFRTADAVGCTKVYLCGVTPPPVDRFCRAHPQIAKVALGAEKWVEWEYVKSASRCIDALKKKGYAIFAVEQAPLSRSCFGMRLKKREWEKTVLVMGSEVTGLSPAILKRADTIIEIPMHGKKESLNVSVAFGVVAFSLYPKK